MSNNLVTDGDARIALTVVEAARRVGIGRTMGYRLAANGTWPTVRIGRAVRVPVAALLDWVEHETQGGPSSGAM
jgi:excisionase family DNA binding protein